jgi:RNA polymerase sigma-70 factor (ECF subfamily)
MPLPEVAIPSSETPDSLAMERELRDRLRLAIAELPPREAEVFCLRYFEELPYDKIAETLGIRRGAVAAALHKARVKLEASLLQAIQEE